MQEIEYTHLEILFRYTFFRAFLPIQFTLRASNKSEYTNELKTEMIITVRIKKVEVVA